MIKPLRIKVGQTQKLLTLLVWILIFSMPLMFGEESDERNWVHIFKVWRDYGFVFVLFLINRYLLLPKLFFKGKRIVYFALLSGLIFVFSFLVFLSGSDDNLQQETSFQPHQRPMMGMHDQEGRPPPPPQGGRLHTPPMGERDFDLPPPRGAKEMLPAFANLFIMSILLLGFDTGLIFSIKWTESEQTKLKIEKESIENKLAFLQNQISPHFFMNTLNNIHALADIDIDESKEAIIKLSQLMGFVIYDSQAPKITLQQELDFVSSYVDLMKLRYTSEIDIKLEMPIFIPNVKLPPLLTISFIENAFKYGISYEKPSFVHIHFEVIEKTLYFRVTNTIHGKNENKAKSGVGIANTRNRLDLIFDKSYSLAVSEQTDNIFNVELTIPV